MTSTELYVGKLANYFIYSWRHLRETCMHECRSSVLCLILDGYLVGCYDVVRPFEPFRVISGAVNLAVISAYKRNDFNFDIVNFPFLDGDVPHFTSYGIYISQLIRFARVSSHVADFNASNKRLTAKLLQQDYRYHKLRKTFSKFIADTMNWFLNSMLD